MSTFVHDLRYAARTLARTRGFAAVVILTLGLGIGANTAFFSIMNAVLIRPLGYADPDRLVALHEANPPAGIERMPFSAPDLLDLKEQQQSFSGVAAYRTVPLEISDHGEAERVDAARVSANAFDVLGVAPRMGRAFSPSEDRPGADVTILSWGLWQRRYGADPAIVGKTIQLDRQPHTVIGVMPSTFHFPKRGQPAQLWVPIGFTDQERAARGDMHINAVIGRLKDGVSLDTARAELTVLSGRIQANYPPILRGRGELQLSAQPLREEISGQIETPLLLLFGAVGLVLLVACANVANLILSRTAARSREIGLRLALGASRVRLLQLLLAEALMLSVAGGALALLIAQLAVSGVPAAIAATIPGLEEVTIDQRVLVFAAGVSIVTAIVFALIPLVISEQGNPVDALREAGPRTTSGVVRSRLQSALVASTVGLAFVLLVGAGLFLRSFTALLSTDAGFRPAQVLTASMSLPRTFYSTASSVRSFHQTVRTAVSELSGVRLVALGTDLPLSRYEFRSFTPEHAAIPDGVRPTTNLTWVDGPYFQALGMTLIRGRFFSEDEHAENRSVVIVNERLASRFWPGDDPMGKRLKWGVAASQTPWLTVVGVIADVADGPLGVEPGVHAYEPFRQFPDAVLDRSATGFGRDVKLAILADSDPQSLTAVVREEIHKLDRQLAIQSIELMEQRVNDSVAPQRFGTMLVTAFAIGALFLAAVGLYGLLAYSVTQRRREIGVRMALGAQREGVIRMVAAQGAKPVFIGLVAGLVASFGTVRLLESLLYQTGRYDLVTFVAVPVVLITVALIACAVPAWRAARVEPLIALRAE